MNASDKHPPVQSDHLNHSNHQLKDAQSIKKNMLVTMLNCRDHFIFKSTFWLQQRTAPQSVTGGPNGNVFNRVHDPLDPPPWGKTNSLFLSLYIQFDIKTCLLLTKIIKWAIQYLKALLIRKLEFLPPKSVFPLREALVR